MNANGCNFRGGKRLVLDIDLDTFEEIRAYAFNKNISVSQAVRDLVEFGLEGEKQ
jgi:hypothetical protein